MKKGIRKLTNKQSLMVKVAKFLRALTKDKILRLSLVRLRKIPVLLLH